MNIFNRNLLIIVLVPCFSWGIQISYNDIINQGDSRGPYVNHSVFAGAFKNYSSREIKIAHLLTCGQQINNHTWKLTIKDVPCTTGAVKTITLSILLQKLKNLSIADTIKSTFRTMYHKEQLVYEIAYDDKDHPDLYLFKDIPFGYINQLNSEDTVSGSTFMRIFDGVCSLCAAGKITLEDQSQLLDSNDPELTTTAYMDLRILYPYIWGTTFYGRFGFHPDLQGENLERYYNIQNMLINRPLTEYLDDFSNNHHVTYALMQGYREFALYPEHFISLDQPLMKHALYVPYIRVKTLHAGQIDPTTHLPRSYYINLLNTVYTNCLDNYTSTKNEAKSQRIKDDQGFLSENYVFAKFYG